MLPKLPITGVGLGDLDGRSVIGGGFEDEVAGEVTGQQGWRCRPGEAALV